MMERFCLIRARGELAPVKTSRGSTLRDFQASDCLCRSAMGRHQRPTGEQRRVIERLDTVFPHTRLRLAAGLSAMAVAYVSVCKGKWDVSFTVNGFLAGLVAITCPCYWVSPFGAVVLGAVAGAIIVLGVELLEWRRIDDPIGAVPARPW